MRKTTLIYIENDGKYLMMLRNKKENDPNEGKWIGIGGGIEPGETPEECVCREVFEETGLKLSEYVFRGLISFRSDTWEDEDMYLYTGSFEKGSEPGACDEGELHWVDKADVTSKNIWEGDRLFLEKLLADETGIRMTLFYEGDRLVRAE